MKFYKTKIEITVISDRRIRHNENPEDILREMDCGDFVGSVCIHPSEEMNKTNTIEALEAVGSDASFFNLEDE